MCVFRGPELSVDFCAARFLHRAHPLQFLFDARQFFLRDAAVCFLSRTLAQLGFDSQLFLLGTTAGSFFIRLPPSLSLLAKCVFSGQPRSFHLGATRYLFGAQTNQLSFKLPDFFSGRKFLLRDGRYCR
jgi:hypothetical protein